MVLHARNFVRGILNLQVSRMRLVLSYVTVPHTAQVGISW